MVRFYKDLMGSAADSLPMVDSSIVHRCALLTVQQQDALCVHISAKEVYDALCGMDPLKAPGYG